VSAADLPWCRCCPLCYREECVTLTVQRVEHGCGHGLPPRMFAPTPALLDVLRDEVHAAFRRLRPPD
jgi:hypothetical protein